MSQCSCKSRQRLLQAGNQFYRKWPNGTLMLAANEQANKNKPSSPFVSKREKMWWSGTCLAWPTNDRNPLTNSRRILGLEQLDSEQWEQTKDYRSYYITVVDNLQSQPPNPPLCNLGSPTEIVWNQQQYLLPFHGKRQNPNSCQKFREENKS